MRLPRRSAPGPNDFFNDLLLCAVRKGPFFASLFVVVGTGAALYFYLYPPSAGSIHGYVMTRTDAPDTGLSNVEVDLTSETDSTIQRSTHTNDKGWFEFPGLPRGSSR